MKPLFRATPFFIFPVAILLLHIVAVKVFDLYSTYPDMDIPAHFLGGVSIAYTAFLLIKFGQAEKMIAKLDRPIVYLLIITITATATVLWEFAEFLSDNLLKTDLQISLANTMQDQCIGFLGGLFVVMVLRSRFVE